MQKIEAVVFDFDGTLTQLTINFGHLRSEIIKIAREYIDEEAVNKMEGHFIIEMIYEIDRNLDGRKGSTEFKNRAFEKLRALEVDAASGKDVFPYTRDVLRSLKDRSIKIGIITRNCIDALRIVFPDISDYVDSIVTRECIQNVKPHPEHVCKALESLKASSKKTLTVGDHPTDVIAGRTAGTHTVGVLTGRTDREAFEKAGATYILDDIRGIINLENILS